MLVLLLMLVTAEARTCYPSNTTRTPYKYLSHATVETPRGCEVLCDAKSECVGFSYREAGFSSSCVLLQSNSANEICVAETTVFLKTTGCPARTSITAEFGVDPCIDDFVPIVQKLEVKGICPQIKANPYVIRAIAANGKRITLDNDAYDWLSWDGEMWVWKYSWRQRDLATPIVAAVCAVAGPEKCPCAPLKHVDIGLPNSYLAQPNVRNPCKSSRQFWFLEKMPEGDFYPAGDTQAMITCHAGIWVFWRESDYNGYGVAGVMCC